MTDDFSRSTQNAGQLKKLEMSAPANFTTIESLDYQNGDVSMSFQRNISVWVTRNFPVFCPWKTHMYNVSLYKSKFQPQITPVWTPMPLLVAETPVDALQPRQSGIPYEMWICFQRKRNVYIYIYCRFSEKKIVALHRKSASKKNHRDYPNLWWEKHLPFLCRSRDLQ